MPASMKAKNFNVFWQSASADQIEAAHAKTNQDSLCLVVR